MRQRFVAQVDRIGRWWERLRPSWPRSRLPARGGEKFKKNFFPPLACSYGSPHAGPERVLTRTLPYKAGCARLIPPGLLQLTPEMHVFRTND